jgi:hypothetical protein
MSLSSLLTILPAPLNQVEAPKLGDWAAIEEQFGKLPADFKAFLEGYGSGTIDHFIWVLNPVSSNRHLNWVRAKEPILAALRELREGGEPCPYPLYPEAGGLLPFGKTDNGDALFWQTIGDPNQWPVIVNAARDPSYEKFDCNMTAFLDGILMRRIRCSVFPDGFPSEKHSFTPE